MYIVFTIKIKEVLKKYNIFKILVDFWQIHIFSFLQALRSNKFDVCIVNS